MTNTNTYRIYVASLASYNAGRLHGVWVDLYGKDESQVMEEIETMLKTCPEHGEEWAIHDFELGGIPISESESISRVIEFANALEEHGDKFKVAYDNFHDLEEAIDAVNDCYRGVYKNMEDYASEYLEESGLLSSVPEALRNYFDFASFGRDLELSDVWTAEAEEGGIHVFTNN